LNTDSSNIRLVLWCVLNVKETIEDDDDGSGGVDQEEEVKAVKNTNKLEEREAALRGTQQTGNTDMTLRVSSHTVDVKNNVEKGLTHFTSSSAGEGEATKALAPRLCLYLPTEKNKACQFAIIFVGMVAPSMSPDSCLKTVTVCLFVNLLQCNDSHCLSFFSSV